MLERVRTMLPLKGYKEVRISYANVYIKPQKDYVNVIRLVSEKDRILTKPADLQQESLGINQVIRDIYKMESRYTVVIEVKDLIPDHVRSIIDQQNTAFSERYIVISALEKKVMLFDMQLGTDQVEQDLSDILIDDKGYKEYRKEKLKKYITPVTLVLFMANVLVYIYLSFKGDVYDAEFMYQNGASNFLDVLKERQYWRLFTSMFLHFGLQHLIGNMIALLFLGNILERRLGKLRYLGVYLMSGMCAGVVSCLYEYYQYSSQLVVEDAMVVSAGASGAVFGIIGALIFLVIFRRKKNEEIDIRQLAWMALFSVLSGVMTTGIDNAAHMGGLVFGFLFAYLLAHRR